MRRTALIGAGLLALLVTTPAFAQEGSQDGRSHAPPAYEYPPPPQGVYDGFMWYKIEPLNSAPSMARHLANECVIAGVGAMAVTALLVSPVAPAVAAALGAGTGMTVLEVGAIGCGGGIAAGVASAAVVWGWEEQDFIRDVAETQVASLMDQYNQATATLGANVASALSEPVAAVQTTMAALTEGAANLLGQGGNAAGSAVQVAAATMSGWWYGQSNGVDDFVTYETASIAGMRNADIVIH